jgi:hypothetical protein
MMESMQIQGKLLNTVLGKSYLAYLQQWLAPSRMAKIRADLQDKIHASPRHPRVTLGKKCAIK